MMISVAVPVNQFREGLLEKCLKSVLACHQMESKPDFQLMVVDSSNDSRVLELVKSLGYFDHYPVADRGMAENWNQAVRLCKGDWIHLLHDDDYNLDEFYQAIEEGIQSEAGAICVGYQVENEQGVITFQNVGSDRKGYLKDFHKNILIGNPLTPSAVVIKRSTYERLGYYLEGVAAIADWEMYCRITIAGIKWWSTPRMVSRRLEHSGAASSKDGDGLYCECTCRSIEIMEKYIPGNLRNFLLESRKHNGQVALDKYRRSSGVEAVRIFNAAQRMLKPLSKA